MHSSRSCLPHTLATRNVSAVRALLLALCSATVAAHAQSPTTTLSPVEVIGTRAVPGPDDFSIDMPGQVQTLSERDVVRRPQATLPQLLEQELSGISISDAQGNAHQAELTFRGFSASPILGTPQGLTLFIDGVRANEAFGDNLNWDLVPPNAIANLSLISGSNPIYGLNTLGGALSIDTKSGFSFPGASAQVMGGSFGRSGLQFELGGHREGVSGFIAGNFLDERGWRRHSSSAIRQLFARTGWRDSATDVDATLTLADNRLEGTQALPLSMLNDPRQPYTWPDRTDNTMHALSLRASHRIESDMRIAGSLFQRTLLSNNLSSNINDDFDLSLPARAGNSPGFNDRNQIRQSTLGGTFRLTIDGSLATRPNQLSFGGAYERSSVTFIQDGQEATFIDDRNTVGTGAFFERTSARIASSRSGLFFLNRWSAAEHWTLTASGRYSVAHVLIRDRSNTAPQLDGDHTYRRFNPGVAMSFTPSTRLSWYASASEAMRAPTPMELTCADPSAPCKLPTGFLADPSLKPVIARTVEAGMRAKPLNGASIDAALYRTALRDDIQFVSSGGATNAGFFSNVGETVRQGFDLGGTATLGRLRLSGGYGRVDARYRSAFSVHSPNNSSADMNGDIAVSRGNRISGIPGYTLKARAEWSITPDWTLSATLNRYGRRFARGDENNADAQGPLPAWHVVHVASWQRLARDWELVLKVDNVFNRSYQSFAVLGENFFRGPGGTFDANAAAPEQFRTPGAPRAAWIYLRYSVGLNRPEG